MIAFDHHPLRIAHINVRTETHGEEQILAVDLNLSFELPNTILDVLSPSLRASLFDAANDPDIFAGEEGLPLTRVRHPHLGLLRWSETWAQCACIFTRDRGRATIWRSMVSPLGGSRCTA